LVQAVIPPPGSLRSPPSPFGGRIIRQSRAAISQVVLLALFVAAPVHAQTSKFDGLRGCERIAAVQFKRHNPAFRRFRIERTSVKVDRYAAMVGSQFVATVYSGKAAYDDGKGAKLVRFLCLHGGIGRGPLFVYTLAE
jgi:hypothetical protein